MDSQCCDGRKAYHYLIRENRLCSGQADSRQQPLFATRRYSANQYGIGASKILNQSRASRLVRFAALGWCGDTDSQGTVVGSDDLGAGCPGDHPYVNNNATVVLSQRNLHHTDNGTDGLRIPCTLLAR